MSQAVSASPSCRECGRVVKSAAAERCRSCRERSAKGQLQNKAKAAIKGLLERDDVLILDTETTGMGKGAEVVEVSVINTQGETLLDTLVKPRAPRMNPHAQRVHGISMTMLKDAPVWPEVLPELSALAERRTVLAWNASFDAGMLERTSAAWALTHPKWLFVCAMRLYAKGRGIRNRGLHKCVVDEDLSYLLEQHRSHRALADVVFVLEVLRASAKSR